MDSKVEIDTFWNVKIFPFPTLLLQHRVEIDTFWNVKAETACYGAEPAGVEIDTFWNVKFCFSINIGSVPS